MKTRDELKAAILERESICDEGLTGYRWVCQWCKASIAGDSGIEDIQHSENCLWLELKNEPIQPRELPKTGSKLRWVSTP